MKRKGKRAGAVMAIGGWDFVKEPTTTSFNKLKGITRPCPRPTLDGRTRRSRRENLDHAFAFSGMDQAIV